MRAAPNGATIAGTLALDAQQRPQGKDAAFAVIVHPHRNGEVFDAGDHDQSPHYQGQYTEHPRRVSVAGEVQHRLEGVERARSNVAEQNPKLAYLASARTPSEGFLDQIGRASVHRVLESRDLSASCRGSRADQSPFSPGCDICHNSN
jgi:hypothetical protein